MFSRIHSVKTKLGGALMMEGEIITTNMVDCILIYIVPNVPMVDSPCFTCDDIIRLRLIRFSVICVDVFTSACLLVFGL